MSNLKIDFIDLFNLISDIRNSNIEPCEIDAISTSYNLGFNNALDELLKNIHTVIDGLEPYACGNLNDNQLDHCIDLQNGYGYCDSKGYYHSYSNFLGEDD